MIKMHKKAEVYKRVYAVAEQRTNSSDAGGGGACNPTLHYCAFSTFFGINKSEYLTLDFEHAFSGSGIFCVVILVTWISRQRDKTTHVRLYKCVIIFV